VTGFSIQTRCLADGTGDKAYEAPLSQ
jgi:hypothetical protein